MAVLSIQSAVAYGFVGNAAATPTLQALGREVWRVDTVALSNHPGYGQAGGGPRDAAEIGAVLRGIADLNVMDRCAAVISGYLGTRDCAAMVARAVAAVREANPDALFILDPVIGDKGRIYTAAGVMEQIRDQLVPICDTILPNRDELGWLTGGTLSDTDSLLRAARALIARGPTRVIITGVPEGGEEGREEGGEIAVYAVDADRVLRLAAPRRARHFNGAGDLFTALYTGFRLGGASDPVEQAHDHLQWTLGETERCGMEELAIMALLPRLTAGGDLRR